MGEVIKVGMADLNVCKNPDIITTLGLGSCIGIALYDPVTKIGGLAHIMLPDSTKMRNNSNIAKFADNVVIMNRGRVLMEGTPREVFVREDFIRQAGLDVPQITNIVKALKAGGMDIPSDIYTMDEAVDAIVRAMRGKNRAGGAEKC